MSGFCRSSYDEEMRRGGTFYSAGILGEDPASQSNSKAGIFFLLSHLFLVLNSHLFQLFLNYSDSFWFMQGFKSSELRSRSKIMPFLVIFQLAALKDCPSHFSFLSSCNLAVSHRHHHCRVLRFCLSSASLHIYFKVKVSLGETLPTFCLLLFLIFVE